MRCARSASMSASGPCRAKSRAPSRSSGIANTPPTTARRATVLAPIGAGRSRDERVSRPLPRQVQPRAFLLGQLRSRGDALFRPHRAAAHQPQPQSRRLGDARGLFARGQQLRLLARQRRLRRAAFYSYAYPEPAGFGKRRCRRPAPTTRTRAIHPALRCGADGGRSRRVLLQFLQRTYEACADDAKWDRRALERPAPVK